AVAVMDVPVEDRDAPVTELRLGVPRRDRDVVEEAEAHGPVCRRVMPGRAYQREAAALGRGDRAARGQQRRLKARLRGEGVRVTQVGSVIPRMRAACSSLWQRSTASTGAGSTSSNSNASSRAASRAGDSGWLGVG